MDNQNELFVVVNRDDKVLEYRTRHDCHHDPNLIHRVATIVLFSDANHIWLQKRSQKKDLYPGKLTLSTSGHVMPNETYEDAIIREMKEEIGVTVPIEFVTSFIHEAGYETEYAGLFRGTYNGEFIQNTDEVDEIVLVSIDKLKDMQDTMTSLALSCLKILHLL